MSRIRYVAISILFLSLKSLIVSAQQAPDVSKLNAMLAEARADNSAGKFDDAASLMQQAIQIKADAAVLWLEMGIAQNGQKAYFNAAGSLNEALSLDAASKVPNPAVEAAAHNALGEAYANSNKVQEAAASYDKAALLQPANAAMFYSNEAVVLSRAGQTDATIAAADKAIAADPSKPIPYYLKGQALVSKAIVDPKTQQIVAPPGTAQAYNKYLELAPNGPMAANARSLLAKIGQSTPPAQGLPVQYAQSNPGEDKRQEVEDKIDELQSDMDQHESAAEGWDDVVNKAADTSSCYGPGASLCQSIAQMGAAKARANANKERSAANQDRAEINRLQRQVSRLTVDAQPVNGGSSAGGGQPASSGSAASGSGYDPGRHYSGPNADTVQSLLASSSGWSCPTSITQSIKWIPPVHQVCMRDYYVTAAVAAAYGAECEARLGREQEAEQDAASMASSVKAAKSMCSNAPHVATSGPDCSTLNLVPCP